MKTFETGAVRGTDKKPMYHLISTIFIRRLAATLEEGIRKGYPAYNWMKGFPVEDVWAHLQDHLELFLDGDVTEDHLGHAAFNLMCIIHFSEVEPNLFNGMPPGCKAGMLKFLALCHAASEAPEQAEVGPGNPSNVEVNPSYSYKTTHHPDGRIDGAAVIRTPTTFEYIDPSYRVYKSAMDSLTRDIETLTQKNAEQALEIAHLKDTQKIYGIPLREQIT